MRRIYYLITALLVLGILSANAQQEKKKAIKSGVVSPTVEAEAIHFSISPPLRDLPPSKGPRTPEQQEAFKKLKKKKESYLNFDMEHRSYPFAATARPYGNDPVWQKKEGFVQAHQNRAPILNFAGQDSPYSVSDCNGAAGPNHFMQGVNTTYAIWDKNGNQVVAPTDFNTLFEGVDGASVNDGDPIVIYDEQADRWLVAEFSGVYTNPDYMLIAVSTTNDPTGTWYRWSFEMTGFPDYEKFGVWRDGYYMGTNTPGGNDIYVFEREVMIAGGANPKMVGFANSNRPNSGFHCVEPLDNDGAFAPVGTPGQFITINDDAWGGSNDEIWIYELDVDWNTTSNSTFQRVQQIQVADFDANFGSSWSNIAQQGTSQKVDAVPQILMFRAQYRNFGTSQVVVCAHTVDVDATDHAGIRWYELENTGSGWSIRQQGTYAPDEHSRWIPSISMDGNRNIALGYNISSASMYPGIRYCGQSATENATASGVMDIAEETVLVGTSSHTSDNRWADYAEMSVDPADDETFWFTTEYANGGSSKSTQIVSFKFDPVIVYDTDAGASTMVTPSTGLNLTANETVEVVVRNYGNNSISNVPVSYQLDGAAPVTEIIAGPIAGGATVNHTFATTADLSVQGTYEFKAYSGLAGDQNHANDTVFKTVEHEAPTYCGATGAGSYEHITNVNFGDISNDSGQSEYADYTSMSTSIDLGASETLTMTIASPYSTDEGLAWVDWNQDYDFDDAGEAFTIGSGNSGSYSSDITVPQDALLGPTRIRIRLHDTASWSSPNATPCGSSGYGEVEDYTIIVTNPTSIKDVVSESSISVSPNPADEKIVLASKEVLTVSIEIVNIKGQVLKTDALNAESNKEIKTSDLSSGVYFVKVIQDEKVIENIKFVVKH